MICADTSIWIAALRDARHPAASHLQELLDRDAVLLPAPVRIEILSGAGPRDRRRLRRMLSALPRAIPARHTWEILDDWLERAARAGERFGLGDLLIGAVAAENNASLWSLDRDFGRLARLGLIKLYHAAASGTD